jgi:hypothetical protein
MFTLLAEIMKTSRRSPALKFFILSRVNAAVKAKNLQKTCCLCGAAFVKFKSIEYCDLMREGCLRQQAKRKTDAP